MKHKQTYFFFLCSLALGFPLLSKAQTPEQNNIVLSEKVLERCKDESPYTEYLNVGNIPTDWLERLKEWFFTMLSRMFSVDFVSDAIEVVAYTVALASIVIIAMKFSGLSFTSLRKPNAKDLSKLTVFDKDTPIGDIDFSKLTKQAVIEENFREAIRYAYLLVLQTLDKDDYIAWEKEKSNYDYLLSLKSTEVYAPFKLITQIYEEAWYGEMPWTDEEYFSHYHMMDEQVQNISKKRKTV